MKLPATLPELLAYCSQHYSDIRAVFAPHAKPIIELSYKEVADQIASFGAGLLRTGLTAGDHIALFSDNHPRWLMSDLAITGIGAVDVPRGIDTATPEFEFILEHSGCVAAILQDRRLYSRVIESPVFRQLKFIVLIDDSDVKVPDDGPKIFKFSELLESGRPHQAEFYNAAAHVKPDTIATIVYTSGTTGSPKGVVLTHGNLMTQPHTVELGADPQPGEILVSILPAWHAYERAVEYFGIFKGVTIVYSDKRYIRDDLIKLCPHLLPCVPRIWEAIYKGIESKVKSGPEKNKKLFHFFVGIGKRYVTARRVVYGRNLVARRSPAGERLIAWLTMVALYPLYRLGDSLVFSKIRKVTGGRLKAAISGGGSLAPYLDDFFEIVGVPILNGYGLTECSPVLTVRRVDHNVRGSVGQPIRNTEVSIRDNNGNPVEQGQFGHVWARGPQVMQGYYKNPEATAKVLNPENWFITGDLGWFTASGDLVIAGRAKDTIVLSSGENVEPEPIEDVCRKSALVQQIVLVGQDRKSLAALVVPDYAALAEALNISPELEPVEIIAHADADKTMRRSLSEVMDSDGRFKASERISKVLLLPEPFTEENGTMTSTMKIKKNVILERYRNDIDQLYN